MEAIALSGKAAEVATLQAKISVARLRSQHAPTKGQRASEAAALQVYEAALLILTTP